MDKFDLVKDLQLFARKLNLKCFFVTQTTGLRSKSNYANYTIADYRTLMTITLLEQEGGVWYSPEDLLRYCESTNTNVTTTKRTISVQEYKNKYCSFPSTSNPRVKSFLDSTLHDIEIMHFKTKASNLSNEQIRALETLKQLIKMLIKPMDKGGNIVIMQETQYIVMCKNILNNKSWYRKMDLSDIQKQYEVLIDITHLNNLISCKTREFLKVKFTIMQTFYALHMNAQWSPWQTNYFGC